MLSGKTLYQFILLFAGSVMTVSAQTSYLKDIQFQKLESYKQNNELHIHFDMNITNVDLDNQHQIILTPVILSGDNTHSIELAPVVISGHTRDKVLRREQRIHKGDSLLNNGLYSTRIKGKEQLVPVYYTISYAQWMRDAELVLNENIRGCANCGSEGERKTIYKSLLPPLHNPAYEIQYVLPEVEPVKQRSETFSAYLNYRVNQSELLRNFGNNATVLADVDKIINEIKNDENLNIQTFTVTGFASPEGDYNKNMNLSKNRAQSFLNYLVATYQLDDSNIKVDWKGEDWEGLRKKVSESSIPDKNRVIEIIDNYDDISQRKQQLSSLNGGATYKFLLNEYYPSLRRNEYSIAYVARPFDLEEAKNIVKTKPQYLSLNEMFLVATSYPKESAEFKDVFDVAVRLFPSDPIANMNAAALEIESGNLDKAIERLKSIEHPEAINNLGVAWAKKGDYEQAAACFKRAAEKGNHTAILNGEQLDLFLKN